MTFLVSISRAAAMRSLVINDHGTRNVWMYENF